ncbi:MAG TPA: response regulator, partial [Candidatus Methylomirabilis sp.]
MTTALRILLVDDDPNDCQLVRQTLEKAFPSMELTEVTEEVGLGRALEQDPPDVVLTDYALGWTSGLAVLLKVKQRWPDVPVLMVTGTGSEEIAVECMKEGLEDYILKSSRHIVRLPSAVDAALERVQERRALREAETRYQSLFAGVSVGLYRATVAGEVLDANPALARSLGYPNRDALIGTCLIDLCVEPEARADWRSLATGERQAIDAEVRMRGQDGGTLWVAHRSRAVREAGGPILCVEGSLEDITARKEAEA